MAQKIQTFLIDDLDSSDAEGTVRFGLDGEQYEIDLSTEHAKELRTALARYIDAGRRVTGTARRAGQNGRKAPASNTSNTAVRTWAKAQGCGACGDRCEGLIFDDAFADALPPVAGDAEDLQVLQGGGAAGRPRDDVISLDQVPGNLAVALAALPVLEQPGGGDLRGGEVASRVEFRER